MKRFVFFVSFLFVTFGAHAADPSCKSAGPALANVLSGMDWNNVFPITIAGISGGGNRNPPQMVRKATCKCASRVIPGAMAPGIMLTYWEPLFVAEIERSPGCASTMGGTKILSGYEKQLSGPGEDAQSGSGAQENFRRQIHWYEYPLFAILELFKQVLCSPGKALDIAYITELDPVWQSDLWSIFVSPEALVVGNPVSALACMADAVAANTSFPMDSLFWCLGRAQIYPLSGNHASGTSNAGDNMTILGRFMARQHRVGLMLRSIGPQAICTLTYDQFLPKEQYRIDPIHPYKVDTSKPIVLGKHYWFWGGFPANNPAGFESSAHLIWRGAQCCIRP